MIKVGGRYHYVQDRFNLLVEITEIVSATRFNVIVLDILPSNQGYVTLGPQTGVWELKAGSWEYLIGQDKP